VNKFINVEAVKGCFKKVGRYTPRNFVDHLNGLVENKIKNLSRNVPQGEDKTSPPSQWFIKKPLVTKCFHLNGVTRVTQFMLESVNEVVEQGIKAALARVAPIQLVRRTKGVIMGTDLEEIFKNRVGNESITDTAKRLGKI